MTRALIALATGFGAQLLAMRWLEGRTEEILPMAREVAASPTIIALDRAYPASVAALAANAGPAHAEEARRELDKLLKDNPKRFYGM